MARKSQWAQFAENFESTYTLGNKLRQAYDTKQVMNDEKFLGAATDDKKAGAGFGLSGDALEKARYKALGDIATKYGDSAGGLSNRTALADLNAKERNNRIDANNEQYTTALKGLIAQNAALADINNTKSRTGLNDANTADVLALTPERVLALQADTAGQAAENVLKEKTQETAIKRANVENDLAAQTASGAIANLDLSIQADREEFKVRIHQAFTAGNVAQQAELESQAFLDYTTRFQDGEFETPKDATRAYINTVAMFDPNKARDMVTKYTEDEIGEIANGGALYQSKIKAMLQKPDGLEQFAEFLDVENGDDVGVKLETSDGVFRLYETNDDGEIVNEIFSTANRDEANSALQELSTYGNSTAYYEKLLSRKKDKVNIELVEANIERVTQVVKNGEAMADLNVEQGKLVIQQTAEIVAGLDLKRGLGNADKEKLIMKETATFLSQLLLMNEDPETRKAKVAAFVEELTARNMTVTEIP